MLTLNNGRVLNTADILKGYKHIVTSFDVYKDIWNSSTPLIYVSNKRWKEGSKTIGTKSLEYLNGKKHSFFSYKWN